MILIPIKLFIAGFLAVLSISADSLEVQADPLKDFNSLSEQFLRNLQDGKDTAEIEEFLAGTSVADLAEALSTDHEKLAFWVNIYNAYIQKILAENPELYNDRREFFKKEQIPIAGKLISFSKIEHGILRKSQWELGLGYVRKWFPGNFERTLRVGKRDYRIHFALNCGAKSCPPVAIYQPARLQEQLNKASAEYLKRTSEYNPDKNEVRITSLFKWFRGDFCGSSGIKGILKEFGIIPEGAKVNLTYQNYDWTLDLNNFTAY